MNNSHYKHDENCTCYNCVSKRYTSLGMSIPIWYSKLEEIVHAFDILEFKKLQQKRFSISSDAL